MSEEPPKLGNYYPHLYRDRHGIWRRAIEGFLWPGKMTWEQEKVRDHRIYADWVSDLGARMRLFPGGRAYFERYPRQSIFLEEMAARYDDGSLGVASGLVDDFAKAWRGLVTVDGNGAMLPANRKAGRGLKFCLLLNVLRYGVQDGEGQPGLVKWRDAVEAASLLLALSLLSQHSSGGDRSPSVKGLSLREGADPFDIPHVPWWDVKQSAASKLEKLHEATGLVKQSDPKDMKHHAPVEWIGGFRQRLWASMDDDSFDRVSKLAAAFKEKGAAKDSSLVRWRDESLLSNWFLVGRD